MAKPLIAHRPNRKRRPLSGSELREKIIAASPRYQFEHRYPGMTYIYAISDGESVKFGRAWNVSKRLKYLQSSSPRKLGVVAVVLASKFLESQIHHYLKDHRLTGEWFRLNDHTMEIMSLMKPELLEQLVAKVS